VNWRSAGLSFVGVARKGVYGLLSLQGVVGTRINSVLTDDTYACLKALNIQFAFFCNSVSSSYVGSLDCPWQ